MNPQATGALSPAHASRPEVSNNLLYGFKAARYRSPRAPRLTAGDAAPVSAPLRPRLRRSRASSEPHDQVQTRPAVAGAVGSAALGSHHGASLEDRGPLRAMAGRSTACPSRSKLTGPDLSPHGSSRPKPLHRPGSQTAALRGTTQYHICRS
jgi:hypothetical protein